MFGSRVTYRDYKAEGPVGSSKKTPTHVSVYREAETTGRSRGIEREGMILVALMSGGDYLPEGIPGCGPKVACAAARAGFGAELCALKGNDTAGLREWKERLEHEIRTNESKFFSQRKTGFQIPEDFPNREVLGYYTHPCVSTPDKLARLRAGLNWEQPIDFGALRVFAGDAFDWRCVGGAKKFIKNLAPALLVRELRRRGEGDGSGQFGGSSGKFGGSSAEDQDGEERSLIQAIHGKRNHAIVDQELEYRISFTPAHFVPIDLSQEDEDDELVPAGGVDEAGIDAEDDFASTPPSSAATALAEDDEEDEEGEPAKKVRIPKPFDPEKPEKAWVLKTFVQVGCPGLVEYYEASLRDPKAFLGLKRTAKATAGGDGGKMPAKRGVKKTTAAVGSKGTGRGKKKQVEGVAENAITRYAKFTKAGVEKEPLEQQTASHSSSQTVLKGAELGGGNGLDDEDLTVVSKFKMPSTQVPAALLEKLGRQEVQEEEIKRRREEEQAYDVVDLSEPTPRAKRPLASGTGVFAAFAARKGGVTRSAESTVGAKPTLCDESEILDLTASPRSLRRLANPAASTVPPASTAPAAGALMVARKVKLKTTAKAKPKTKILSAPQQIEQEATAQRTPPRRKRPSQELSSPAVGTPSTQRTITGYWSPGPQQPLQPVYFRRASQEQSEVAPSKNRDLTPTPPNIRDKFIRSPAFALPAPSFRRLSAGDDKEGNAEFMPCELPGTVTKRRRKGGWRRWQTAPVRGSDDLFEGDDLVHGETGMGGGMGGELGGESGGMDLAGCPSPSPARFYGSGGHGGGFLIDDPVNLADEDVEDEDQDLPSPSTFLLGIGRRVREDDSQPAPIKLFARPRSSHSELPSSYPKSPRTANANPLTALPPRKPTASALPPVDPSPSDARNTTLSLPSTRTPSLDPPANATAEQKRTLLILRRSLEGAWKEIDADIDTLSTRGSRDLLGRGALAGGFRKSGVEVLDLTGD
ncbi:hypothetical protein LTR48_003625 [Friedmanniomyces endolithicus]|uniref:Holliday junction resolvase Gen1 C-terminal domain-containing protein n=1 Tax=Rachicladosporium monterosium TaxID=1507873 RepID=A0ABR0L7B3_9PEZI|nr:hypothetical protein LTR48_003625 [Friedmanniomyces endolithicus]KAK5144599.1 hypothetical protein LTR32_003512 [Rachicladosporium monterosium]